VFRRRIKLTAAARCYRRSVALRFRTLLRLDSPADPGRPSLNTAPTDSRPLCAEHRRSDRRPRDLGAWFVPAPKTAVRRAAPRQRRQSSATCGLGGGVCAKACLALMPSLRAHGDLEWRTNDFGLHARVIRSPPWFLSACRPVRPIVVRGLRSGPQPPLRRPDLSPRVNCSSSNALPRPAHSRPQTAPRTSCHQFWTASPTRLGRRQPPGCCRNWTGSLPSTR